MDKPTEVNILGVIYSIQYVDNPTDVDMYKRQALWGQIDFWTRTIRIYDAGRKIEDIFQSIIHEVLHGICVDLHLKTFNDETNHDDLDVLALALVDMLIRNGWVTK
jgi:hypothetical protein